MLILVSLIERSGSELERIEKHTEIFASMCPDEILDYYNDFKTRSYYATLMLGDVSGFTELTEKYTSLGLGGPSKLTDTLNSYFAPMIQEILSNQGDVLKFSGDAFITMWKLQEGMLMQDVAAKVIQIACVIQKHFGVFETDIGVSLRVKLAIASGKIYFTSIGEPKDFSYFIITGQTISELKLAEGLCKGGEVIVSPSCWQWVDPNDYIFKLHPDGSHIAIFGISAVHQEYKESFIEESDGNTSEYLFPQPSGVYLFEVNLDKDSGNQMESYDYHSDVDYRLRPKVIMVAKKRLKNELKSYILKPVIRSVELDEPLEHLTEIRQVVIVFVNVIITPMKERKVVSLINEAYKLVYSIVDGMQGCVNKTSMFDKDIMFLCIFGLKGGKQALESKKGLYCASKLKRSLDLLENLESVTVAVSTGTTYCGVVGHVLRREFTVIGMPVNKAARLMVAYNNKIVCDRESFLHSQLESSHFVLQESINLKGITNVGPIYEFIEQLNNKKLNSLMNLYPILDRTFEVKMFRLFLKKAMEKWKLEDEYPLQGVNTVLLIKGEPRIGKTRLLDEITQLIPRGVGCNYISLDENDRQIAFALINLLFCIPLELTSSSRMRKRQHKIEDYLNKTEYPQFLCIFNDIFNVNFRVSSRYLKLSDRDKEKLLNKLIGELTMKCFKQLEVIIIDDIEYSDEESLSLLPAIINQKRILFVISLGDDKIQLPFVLMESAQIIELSGIDKWFHAALTCQFLNVCAIPPELEKVIQEKSLGNPGWIESYLVSLKQVGGIEIKKVSQENVKIMSLVVPQSIMIEQRRPSEILKKIDNKSFNRIDRWSMYETSYGESISSICRHYSKEDDKHVSVCIVPQDFHLQDISPELEKDVISLTLFDSLKPLDQILLKCAAVLGETIDRNLLEKLMEKTANCREIALTIKKLFEMRILSCATGNFIRNFGPIVFKSHSQRRNSDFKCGCTVHARESIADLPKYAACSLLRFQVAKFRDTAYRLLTEAQKKDFHKKALQYLQHSTRKCESCGSKFFNKILGHSYYIKPKIFKRKVQTSDEMIYLSDFEVTDYLKTNESDSNIRKLSYRFFMRPEIEITPKSFSNVNLSNCQCNFILITVYTQILNHCQVINRPDKALTTILEFVEILLEVFNIPLARKLLNDAEKILDQIFKSRDDEVVTISCLKGKIKRLEAKCYLKIGLINEAMKSLNEGMKSMGHTFPESECWIKLKTKIVFQKLKSLLTCLRNRSVGSAFGDVADYNDQLSKCLSMMVIIFQIKGMAHHAVLAAIWSLNIALISSKSFITLCTAFSNAITIAYKFNNEGLIAYLENDALEVCWNEKESSLEKREVKSIVKLYISVFHSYFLKGRLDNAATIGFIALDLAKNIRAIRQQLLIIPRLIYLLINDFEYKKIISLLQYLDEISSYSRDNSSKTWYYAVCVGLQLEAGIALISVEKCEQYYQKEGQILINIEDSDAKRAYFTSIWLWHLRMRNWDDEIIWRRRKEMNNPAILKVTFTASISALRNLEGLLIFYVYKIDGRNEKAIKKTRMEIEEQLKVVKKLKRVVKPIVSRYLLLKAYYYMIESKRSKAEKSLKKSKSDAKSTRNNLMFLWIEHCEHFWNSYTKENKRNTWRRRCSIKPSMNRFRDDTGTFSTVFYSLPLPREDLIS